MADLFSVQKKVLIPESQFQAILSENKKKTEPNTPLIRFRQLQDKMQKEKIRNKNDNDVKWDKLTKKLSPIFKGNANADVNTTSTNDDTEEVSSSPLDVANYISEEIEARNLTKSLNLYDVCLRYPEQISITKDRVTVNGKLLSINTLDLFRNLVGSAKKKLSFAAKPLLQVISQEPDVLNCLSNREARAYVTSQIHTPQAQQKSARKRTSVAKNLNAEFDDAVNDESYVASPSASPSPLSSAKRKKGSGSGKLKIRWVEHF